MAKCYTCGDHYEDSFQIVMKDMACIFDDTKFCCVHCAGAASITGLVGHKVFDAKFFESSVTFVAALDRMY